MPARHQPLVYLPTLPPPCEYGEAVALAECLPDPRARERLIEGHLRLALKTATDFAEQWHEDLENCFSVAQVALVQAVDLFDLSQGKDIYAFIEQRIKWRLKDYIDADRREQDRDESGFLPKTINLRSNALTCDPQERNWEPNDEEAPRYRVVPGKYRTIGEQVTRSDPLYAAEQTLREILALCDDREARMVAELINHDGKIAPVARVMGVSEYMIRKWRAALERRFEETPRRQSERIFKILFGKRAG